MRRHFSPADPAPPTPAADRSGIATPLPLVNPLKRLQLRGYQQALNLLAEYTEVEI
jgi:hypothetical protein